MGLADCIRDGSSMTACMEHFLKMSSNNETTPCDRLCDPYENVLKGQEFKGFFVIVSDRGGDYDMRLTCTATESIHNDFPSHQYERSWPFSISTSILSRSKRTTMPLKYYMTQSNGPGRLRAFSRSIIHRHESTDDWDKQRKEQYNTNNYDNTVSDTIRSMTFIQENTPVGDDPVKTSAVTKKGWVKTINAAYTCRGAHIPVCYRQDHIEVISAKISPIGARGNTSTRSFAPAL